VEAVRLISALEFASKELQRDMGRLEGARDGLRRSLRSRRPSLGGHHPRGMEHGLRGRPALPPGPRQAARRA
jgi:hypothetical protein